VPQYGRFDGDYGMKLAASAAADPIYMLSLVKYQAEAHYGNGAERGLTGWEADCRYAPLDELLEAGAYLCFSGDVLASHGGWDSVGVVRFPTRHSFMDMISRSDFRQRHVRREPGMERIITMGTLPVGGLPAEAGGNRMLVEVWSGSAPEPMADGSVAGFDVEGTIIGDGRGWTGARYTAIEPGTALPLEPPRQGHEAMLVEPRIARWL
jgi:hypothetical protein